MNYSAVWSDFVYLLEPVITEGFLIQILELFDHLAKKLNKGLDLILGLACKFATMQNEWNGNMHYIIYILF